MTTRILFLISCLMGGAAALAVDVPAGGVEMLPAGGGAAMSSWGGAKREVVATNGLPFAKALRLTVATRPAVAWNVGASFTTRQAAKKGDVVLAVIWLRGEPADATNGEAMVCVVYENHRDPGFAAVRQTFRLGREWKEYLLPSVVGMNTAAEEGRFTVHAGFGPQTIEVGGARLLNYGRTVGLEKLPFTRFSYPGQEPNAPWRKAAAARIEQFRKANLVVRVVDADGRNISGTPVSVRMTRSAFGFGTAVALDELLGTSADSEKYRAVLEKYFNKATTENGLRWNNWAFNKEQSKKQVGASLDWFKAHRIDARGHYLAWGPMESRSQPRDYKGRPEELRRDLFAHIEEITKFVGKRVAEWDAVNHPIGWGPRTYGDECGVSFYGDIIRRGRQLQSQATMWINEEINEELVERRYLALTRELVQSGATPDGVGFMGHFKGGLLPGPEEMYRRCDEFARVVPSLQFTELDMACGADEQLQADHLRDMLTMAYSHPAFKAVVVWGFWEARHWVPSAALWRRDWTMKPAAKVWENLVLREWRTNADGVTDAAGMFAVRGHLGEYEVRATVNGKTSVGTALLAKDGAGVTVRLSRE